MRLEDLAEIAAFQPARASVPAWSFGAVHRRSITFATGASDAVTRVRWVQSHAMTGDIRINPLRPAMAASDRLGDLDLESLIQLASVEGGIAATAWADGVMSWSNWVGFQPYDKYPEPGQLQRIGDCMIEFAPSAIYVEDWRFQPSAPGTLAALTLLAEIDHSGVERPRHGGLVIAGDHAIQSIARRDEFSSGTRCQDVVRHSATPIDAINRIMDCTVDYGRRDGPQFAIEASTDPRREGTRATFLDGFRQTKQAKVVEQTVTDCDGVASRMWKIESFERDVVFSQSTTVAADRIEWLEQEADTLVIPAATASTG